MSTFGMLTTQSVKVVTTQMAAMVTVDVTFGQWENAAQMAAEALPVKVVTRQLKEVNIEARETRDDLADIGRKFLHRMCAHNFCVLFERAVVEPVLAPPPTKRILFLAPGSSSGPHGLSQLRSFWGAETLEFVLRCRHTWIPYCDGVVLRQDADDANYHKLHTHTQITHTHTHKSHTQTHTHTHTHTPQYDCDGVVHGRDADGADRPRQVGRVQQQRRLVDEQHRPPDGSVVAAAARIGGAVRLRGGRGVRMRDFLKET